jgi:hypothetical protein
MYLQAMFLVPAPQAPSVPAPQSSSVSAPVSTPSASLATTGMNSEGWVLISIGLLTVGIILTRIRKTN